MKKRDEGNWSEDWTTSTDPTNEWMIGGDGPSTDPTNESIDWRHGPPQDPTNEWKGGIGSPPDPRNLEGNGGGFIADSLSASDVYLKEGIKGRKERKRRRKGCGL